MKKIAHYLMSKYKSINTLNLILFILVSSITFESCKNLSFHKIYSNETSMQVKHSHFKSWENDTIKILYNNYEYESTRIECNLELTNPVLYALDKLNAMY